MTRTLLLAGLLSGAATLAAAQDLPARDTSTHGGAGARTGNITSTGATVPNPGEPQASGTTPLDRGIEQQDNKITGSICKGC